MIGRNRWIALAAVMAAAPLAAQEPAKPFAADAEVRAQLKSMLAAMKPDQGFAFQPLVRDGKRVAGIEIWKRPGRPAVHPAEAEYAIVLEGRGELLSGGTLAEPATRNPGLVEGSRIDGGQRRTLGPGDVILIPAGVPHWFGITAERLVLIGMKVPGSD
jgi:mannose-6-phosphate isomerase-like protein (cupin superfamily)